MINNLLPENTEEER